MDLATLFFHSPMHTRKEKRAIGRLREARTQSFFLGISVVDGPLPQRSFLKYRASTPWMYEDFYSAIISTFLTQF